MYIYTDHALRRMRERRIRSWQVESVIETGEVIFHYPNDRPYPSSLILGWIEEYPLHVVAAPNDDCITVITVYVPGTDVWMPGFRVKKPTIVRKLK